MKAASWRAFSTRLAFVIVFLSSAALAHPMKGVGDFYAGMLHPVTTLEAVLPLIALSLLAGQQARETAIQLLAAFPAVLVLGAALVLYRSVSSYLGTVELVITAALGLLVALGRRLPSWLPLGLGILLGLAVGWSNAAEITGDISALRFVAGLAVAGLLLVAYGIGLVRHLKWPWTQIAVRVVGSWIAAVGILVLGLR
jgi:urease accessory protein